MWTVIFLHNYRRAACVIAFVSCSGLAGLPQTSKNLLSSSGTSTATANSLPGVDAGQVTTLVVEVRQPSEDPLPVLATVRLIETQNKIDGSAVAQHRKGATFRQVPLGHYRLEVTAMGFAPAIEEGTLPLPADAHGTVTVYVRPERPPGTSVVNWIPPLSSKIGKEYGRAVDSTRLRDWKEAPKHVERVLKMAPGHPEVNYLAGVYYLWQEKPDLARPYLLRAAYLNPDSISAASALGGLLYRERNYKAALPVLEQAVTLEPSSWELEWTAASAAYSLADFARAHLHSSRAFGLGRTIAPRTELLLAYSLAATGLREDALQHARSFLKSRVEADAGEAANQLMRSLSIEGAQPEVTAAPQLNAALAMAPPTLLAARLPARLWAPPDVDDEIPAVSTTEVCSLPEVLESAGKRIETMMDSLQRIGATETIEDSQIDAYGRASASQHRKTGYAVEIRQVRPGMLAVQEYRDLSFMQEVSVAHPVAHGLGALALVFHPYYSGNFEMTCEGVGSWNGKRAWQIHFHLRAGRPSLHAYVANGNVYDANLKGRAFIAVDNSELLHLETDLMEPLPQIGLEQEHLGIDYGEAGFPKKSTKFWIPIKAEAFINMHGHLHRLKHSFTDFILFSVDATEQQQAPKQP